MPTVAFTLGGTLNFVSEPQGYALMTISYKGLVLTARGDDMGYTLATGMQVHVQVSYVDAKGHPARVDGDVSWGSSDEAIAHVEVDPNDSTRAVVQGVGDTLGIAQVTATADADLGEGVREVITTADVEVVAGEAISGTIAPTGAAEPIP